MIDIDLSQYSCLSLSDVVFMNDEQDKFCAQLSEHEKFS